MRVVCDRSPEVADSPRPNIVLIMTDQHNPHVMGCAGNGMVRTPSLDALAREGVAFTNGY